MSKRPRPIPKDPHDPMAPSGVHWQALIAYVHHDTAIIALADQDFVEKAFVELNLETAVWLQSRLGQCIEHLRGTMPSITVH